MTVVVVWQTGMSKLGDKEQLGTTISVLRTVGLNQRFMVSRPFPRQRKGDCYHLRSPSQIGHLMKMAGSNDYLYQTLIASLNPTTLYLQRGLLSVNPVILVQSPDSSHCL